MSAGSPQDLQAQNVDPWLNALVFNERGGGVVIQGLHSTVKACRGTLTNVGMAS